MTPILNVTDRERELMADVARLNTALTSANKDIKDTQHADDILKHAEAYFKQAEKMLVGNERTLIAENTKLSAELAAAQKGINHLDDCLETTAQALVNQIAECTKLRKELSAAHAEVEKLAVGWAATTVRLGQSQSDCDALRLKLVEAYLDVSRYQWIREQNADLESGIYVGDNTDKAPEDITWVGSDLDIVVDTGMATKVQK